MPRRPPPAPVTGLKPQTGRPPGQARRRGPPIGPRLAYMVHLHGQGLWAELADQELRLLRERISSERADRGRIRAHMVPCPLTGPVRARPAEDPLLRLDAEAIARLGPQERSAIFDPTRPAIAVILEFLGSRQDLPPLGVIPAAQAGDLFVGWVNLDRVPALAEHPAVVRIEALRTWAPNTDPDAGARGASDGGASFGATGGRGVRLAVIDLGFDFLHPGLVRQVGEGGTEQVRTLWLHDMRLPPPPSAPAGALGRRLSGAELQDALDWYGSPGGQPPGPSAVETHLMRLATVAARPEYRAVVQQHGTAVTGIAAGNGRGPSAGFSSLGDRRSPGGRSDPGSHRPA